MSSRPHRSKIVPAKYAYVSPTVGKSNGVGFGVVFGSKRTSCTAPAMGDTGSDSRCSTPVSTTSSAGGSQRPSAGNRGKSTSSCPPSKSRKVDYDAVDDDDCELGLEAIDETQSNFESYGDDDMDDQEPGNSDDDLDGSLADESASVAWSEAADSVAGSAILDKAKLFHFPRRPKSPEYMMDDADLPSLVLPESSTDLLVENNDLMSALQVYEVLRRFRSIVRLSPFRFEDFCAALTASAGDDQSNLIVDIHVALIRALLREDDGNNTTFGPQDTKDSITIAMHFVDAMTWYECIRAYLDSDPDSVEFRSALPLLSRTSYASVTVTERLLLLRTLADLFLATNRVREELTSEGNIQYDDHCRACHRLGDLLCCDTCPAVYHLACLETPLAEVPEEEWQCSVCKQHELKGVTDCSSEVEKSGLLCRQEPIGYDRHRRKYWFMCRRIIVESEDGSSVWYYSTVPQLEELLHSLDSDIYERDLVQVIGEIREDIDRQMQLTEQLTTAVQAGRKSVITVLNDAIQKKQAERAEEQSGGDNAEDDGNENTELNEEPDTGDADDAAADDARNEDSSGDVNTIQNVETVNGEQQMNGNGTTASDNVRETSRVTTTNQLSTTLAPKVLMVINKDGLKTIMTLVSGKSMSESDSGSNLVADASNDSQDSNSGLSEGRRVVTRSKTGSLAPKQFTDSVLPSVSLKTALKASLADLEANDPGRLTRSRSAVNASFVVSSLPGFFRLGMEGNYKHYQNQYRTNALALNKNQHADERDKRRHLSHKFSLSPASEFTWNGTTFGTQALILATLRASILQLESNIPAPLLHPNWTLHRTRWLKLVNACSQPHEFGAALATFEAAVKPVVFNQVWHEALGHTRLRRCPFLDRDETRKRDRELRRRKAEEEEEIQCKNTWVKYSLGLRHQVWKQKGEVYRITGQGGWYWVSVSRPSRPVLSSNLGLRLVAKKLQARKLKQCSFAADELCDQKPSWTQIDQDEKPSISVTGSSEHEEKFVESKPELEWQVNEDVAKSEVVKEEQLESIKECVKCENDETCKDEVGECKSEVKDDDFIDVSDTTENSSDIGDNFSISEALISRTLYPRITKPYSKLDTFLDRRLLQFNAEQKQRLLCEQLIAQYRTQEADRKKQLSASDMSTEAESDVTEDADDTAKPDSATGNTPVSSSQCYSALCRCAGETPYPISCYSPVCRQQNYPAKSTSEQLHDNRLMDSAVEASKNDNTKTLSTDDFQDHTTQTGNAAEDSAGCKKDILPKAENSSVSSVVNSLSAESMQNCMTSGSRARSRASRKKQSAVGGSRNKSLSNSDKAAPSLSLQKYTQDGKIHLTAELVKELEEALAICGQTQHKVSLVRRAGPGRPPTKSNSRLSGIQKKVSLPPIHRFMSGRSSRRSLFALERHFLTKLARREGRWECPGFNYACKMTNVGWPYPCPRPFFRTAWRYRTQTLHSIASAAVQLRVLWACIRWDDTKAHVPPGGTNTITTDLDITTTELLKKRDLPPCGLRSEYLVRKIIVPISVPASQTRENYTPHRSGLRERRRAESPKLKEPTVTEVWLPEEQLDLWQIKSFTEKAEKQKAATAAQEKAVLKPQQDAASSSVPTPVSLAANELASRLEDDLKQQKAAMAQKRLSELQGKAVTLSTATPSSSLVSRICLVQPSSSGSSTPIGQPVSAVSSRLLTGGLQPSSAGSSSAAGTAATPSSAGTTGAVQNLRIIHGTDGQVQVQGLLPGQQVVRLPDGRLHLISAITPHKTVGSSSSALLSQTLPASSSTPRPTSAPRQLLIRGQRFVLSSTPGAQVLLAPGNVEGQKTIASLSGSALSQPQLMLTSPSQSTMIRMPSGQHVVLRSLQPGTVMATPQSSTAVGINAAQSLFSATGKSPPSSSYSVTPEVVQQVVSQALLQAHDPDIQAKLLAMQRQMQLSGAAIPADSTTTAVASSRSTLTHDLPASVATIRHNRVMTAEEKEEQTRMAACMQVMKSLLDSIDRQERIDLKRQRKQETSDERLKRMSQQRLDSLLQKHRDNLRKDILKKRHLLEREIANEIHAEISAALAARYNRNTASAVTASGRKRKADALPAATAAATAIAGSPMKSVHRDSGATNRRRTQKTSAAAAASYQSKTNVDDTLYCLCKTPYDESKFYIGCDRCDDWFHGSCVGVTKSEADRMDTYVCPICQQKESVVDADAASVPLQERHWLELRRVVTSLQTHKMGWPFLEPVDASEVPDYYIVIKEPMDLQTIRNKVEFRQYKSVNDFVKDVTKMFDNCRYYNAPNTPFYRCAEVLEIYFVEKLKSLKAKL